MAESQEQELPPAEDDGVLDPGDTLETDDLAFDPLDAGIITADRYRSTMLYGLTADEAGHNEPFDRQLAAEEPDVDPYSIDDRWSGGPSPRAGRLEQVGDDVTAADRGVDGGAAGAEEAAVHLTSEELEGRTQLGDATTDETLLDAIYYTGLDQRRDAERPSI